MSEPVYVYKGDFDRSVFRKHWDGSVTIEHEYMSPITYRWFLSGGMTTIPAASIVEHIEALQKVAK